MSTHIIRYFIGHFPLASFGLPLPRPSTFLPLTDLTYILSAPHPPVSLQPRPNLSLFPHAPVCVSPRTLTKPILAVASNSLLLQPRPSILAYPFAFSLPGYVIARERHRHSQPHWIVNPPRPGRKHHLDRSVIPRVRFHRDKARFKLRLRVRALQLARIHQGPPVRDTRSSVTIFLPTSDVLLSAIIEYASAGVRRTRRFTETGTRVREHWRKRQ